MEPSFDVLACEMAIPLPEELRRFLASGRTTYAPDWSSTWKQRMLECPPILSSAYDFEWIEPASSSKTVRDWLNPQFQDGRRFLPFAETGAGDAICLVPIGSNAAGVAIIAHDSDQSQIVYRSFADFVSSRFLQTFADMSHLVNNFSEQEAIAVLTTDVSHTSQYLGSELNKYLRDFCRLPPAHRAFQDGPRSRPRDTLSLITQDHLDTELAKLSDPDCPPFPIVARWEVPAFRNQESAEKPVANWRVDALNPQKKLSAIRQYQLEFGVSLLQAKKSIDDYAQSAPSEA